MFTESDRVNIRHFLGYSAIFLQADPRLENAITAVQSIADGGTRPDSSTETAIKGWISDLQTVETNLKALWPSASALTVDEIKIDPYRGMMMLRSEGRRLVNAIARQLATSPRADIFSSSSVNANGDTFENIYSRTPNT